MNINIDVLKNLLKHTNFVFYGKGDIDQQLNEYNENAIIIEKSLKALEIIKNKCVDCWGFIADFKNMSDEEKTYAFSFNELTKEEIDILQEVLL